MNEINQTLTQIQEELYKEYKGKRIPANEGNGNIVIGQEFLDDIFNFVSIRVIEKVNQVVLPKVQKFIDKVESGKARSKETYNDMKEIRDFLSTLIEQK